MLGEENFQAVRINKLTLRVRLLILTAFKFSSPSMRVLTLDTPQILLKIHPHSSINETTSVH